MELTHNHATQHNDEQSDWIALKCVTQNVIEFLLTRQTASAMQEESYKAVEGEKADDRPEEHRHATAPEIAAVAITRTGGGVTATALTPQLVGVTKVECSDFETL